MSGNNINIEPRESTGKAKSTKGGNISLKPGDDIELCSHHRRFGNRDEVTVKVLDGDDNPVKLQIKVGDITLSSEGKASTMAKDEDTGLDTETPLYSDPNVMNINVTTGSGKGYLKVRAQAIDLRCEDHGGIAIQPKGYDNPNGAKFDGIDTITAEDIANDNVRYMNKIKFEHGGGDGLEFGTFNAEKTSLYTDEYRFKKNGVWKMATRTTVASDKADANDPTTTYKYVKQADDFYDVINQNDPTCTTEDIIKAASLIGKSYTYSGKILNYIFTKIPQSEAGGNPVIISTCPSFANIDGGGEASYMSDGDTLKIPGDVAPTLFNQADIIDIATSESSYTILTPNVVFTCTDPGSNVTYWKVTREFTLS